MRTRDREPGPAPRLVGAIPLRSRLASFRNRRPPVIACEFDWPVGHPRWFSASVLHCAMNATVPAALDAGARSRDLRATFSRLRSATFHQRSDHTAARRGARCPRSARAVMAITRDVSSLDRSSWSRRGDACDRRASPNWHGAHRAAHTVAGRQPMPQTIWDHIPYQEHDQGHDRRLPSREPVRPRTRYTRVGRRPHVSLRILCVRGSGVACIMGGREAPWGRRASL